MEGVLSKHEAGRRSVAAEARPAALAASLSLSVSLLCGLSEAAIYSSVTTAYNSAAAGTTTSKAATAAASTGPLQGYARYVLASSVVPSSFTSRTAVASQSFLLSNLNPNLSASHTLKQLVSESGSVRYQLEVLGKLRSAAMVAAAGFVLVNSCLAYREGVGAYGGTVARGTAEIDWSRRLLIGRDGSPLLTLRMGDSVYLTDLLYQAPRAGLGRTVPVLRSSSSDSGAAAADFESAVAAASGGLGTACFLTQKAAAEQISRLCTRDESAAPKNVLIQAVGRDVHDLNQAKKLASVIDASGGNAVVVYIENDGDTAHASRAGKYRSSRASRAHSSNTATVLSISVHEAALTPLRQWLQLQERKLSTAAPSPALGSEVATKTSPASAILTPAAAAIASPIAAAETTTAAEPLTEPALLAASGGAPLLQLVAALDAIGGTVRSACEAALALALSGVTTSAAGVARFRSLLLELAAPAASRVSLLCAAALRAVYTIGQRAPPRLTVLVDCAASRLSGIPSEPLRRMVVALSKQYRVRLVTGEKFVAAGGSAVIVMREHDGDAVAVARRLRAESPSGAAVMVITRERAVGVPAGVDNICFAGICEDVFSYSKLVVTTAPGTFGGAGVIDDIKRRVLS